MTTARTTPGTGKMQRGITLVGVLLLCSGLLAAPVAGSSGTSQPAETDDPALYVELTAEGDATVSLVSVYDLTDQDERDAFETLEADDDDRTELLDRFTDRMQSVATNTDTDREMTVAEEAIDFRTTDDRGIVVLSVSWESLAAVDDGQLTVTEPFASGYEADRSLTVAGPDGSTVETATPEPSATTDGQASWDAGTDLDGFEVTVTLSDENADADDDDGAAGADDSVPGFGIAVTAVALLALLGAGLRHRS